MIVISSDVVLPGTDIDAGVNANNPRIGWHTLLPLGGVVANNEEETFPATNLALPATHLRWRSTVAGSPTTYTLTLTLPVAEAVNYYAIAGHNFGSTGCTVQLQSSENGSDWDDVTQERLLVTDYALMEEFADVEAGYFRLRITCPGATFAQCAVLHIGRVLRMQRRIYVGFRPPTLNRDSDVSSGFSENGQFLGRVIRSQALQSAAEFKNITPDWYREVFEPFAVDAVDHPFFFAWRPGSYPDEIGYMWIKRDVEVTNQRANGMVSISMNMQGIR
jgi:hypothetical protein